MLGLIGEIGLQQDDGVATRIARAPRRLAAERVHGGGVSDTRAAEDAQRHHLMVGRQRVRGGVGAAIVVDEHLVLARLLLEHLAKAPDEQTDGRGLIVGWYAEEQHEVLDARSGYFVS